MVVTRHVDATELKSRSLPVEDFHNPSRLFIILSHQYSRTYPMWMYEQPCSKVTFLPKYSIANNHHSYRHIIATVAFLVASTDSGAPSVRIEQRKLESQQTIRLLVCSEEGVKTIQYKTIRLTVRTTRWPRAYTLAGAPSKSFFGA
jgi:hypothetical protein